jgi:hypothetical protein
MSTPQAKIPEEPVQRLKSRKYNFLVEGSMPILNFEITSGGKEAPIDVGGAGRAQSQKLTLELYAPVSGEIFEARTPKGRIEVDTDGTVTYFSQTLDAVSFSLFVGKSIIVTMSKKTGEVSIKTPSKIVSIEDHRASKSPSSPTTDEVKLVLQ